MKKYLYIGGFILVLFGIVVLWRTATIENLENVTFIKNGERVCSSAANNGTECKFLEYSADETFRNEDEWVFLKWDSGDVHRIIQAGMTCQKVQVYGWRIHFLSWFRNIISVDGCVAK